MSYQPNTILARWPGANQSSAVPIIARTITNNLGGIGAGRRAVQIRPFRLQGPSAKLYAGPGEKDDGRNMFVLRSLSTSELMTVFVEDPSAPTRLERKQQAAAASGGKGKEKEDKMMVEDGDATAPLRATDNDDEDDDDDEPGHTRWTYCSLGVANAVTPLVTPFDAFLQRVLLGSGGQAANSSNPSTSWIPRSTAVSLEGFVFHLGGAGGVGDWEIKVGSVMVKGGASGGTSRGVLVEATYLAVPYLPAGSTILQDFVKTLFPVQAVNLGEIEWLPVDYEGLYEAGLVKRPVEGDGKVEGEWEWKECHASWTYVQTFKKEGLL